MKSTNNLLIGALVAFAVSMIVYYISRAMFQSPLIGVVMNVVFWLGTYIGLYFGRKDR